MKRAFLLSLLLISCGPKAPKAPVLPQYTQESYKALDEYLVGFQSEFFSLLKEVEENDIFRGTHPEISKAKLKVLRIYETRPIANNESWESFVRTQIQLGEELIELSENLTHDKSFSPLLNAKLQSFYSDRKKDWHKELSRFGLAGEALE